MHKFTLVCALSLALLIPACNAPTQKQAVATKPLRLLEVSDEIRILVVHFHVSDISYWMGILAEFGEVTPNMHLVDIDIQNKMGEIVTALFYLVPAEHVTKYRQQKEMKQQPQQPEQKPQRPAKDPSGVQVPA